MPKVHPNRDVKWARGLNMRFSGKKSDIESQTNTWHGRFFEWNEIAQETRGEDPKMQPYGALAFKD